jgi:hypothetical protein
MMIKFILIFLFIAYSFSQRSSEYYLKFYNNSYVQNGKTFNENYDLNSSFEKSRYNTSNIDLIYRFSPIFQGRILISYVNVNYKNVLSDISRSGITDLWFEGHYYLSQYPKKQYIAVGFKVPLGYEEKEDPWLANGALEFRLKVLRKEKVAEDWDYEVDFTFDYSLIESDRINRLGYAIPYYIALSYYKNQFTFSPTFTGSFKSYEYGVIGSYGDRFNQFDFETGLTLKYKLNSELEVEIAYKRTITAFQTAQANSYGIGISFGIRD